MSRDQFLLRSNIYRFKKSLQSPLISIYPVEVMAAIITISYLFHTISHRYCFILILFFNDLFNYLFAFFPFFSQKVKLFSIVHLKLSSKLGDGLKCRAPIVPSDLRGNDGVS